VSTAEAKRLLVQAQQRLQGGQWAAAEALCRQALTAQPQEPMALHLLGVSLLQQARFEDAEQALAACRQAQPGEPAALGNHGIALLALGRFDEALACYVESLAKAPAQPATLNMQGLALTELKRFDEAVQSFDHALALAPNLAEAWCNRANPLIQLRRYDEALESLDRAEALRPDYGEALSNRSIVLNLLGRHDEALTAARGALALLPDRATVQRNLADALAGLRHFDQAAALYARAIGRAPRDPALRAAAADVLAMAGRDTDAARCWSEAIGLVETRIAELKSRPHEDAQARSALAQAWYELGLLQVDAALHRLSIDSFVEAARLLPEFAEARWAEALNRLRLGDYERGWPLYEWRRRRRGHGLGLQTFSLPEWRGDDPAHRHLLLHSEQGLGDALQFCRYAPLLARRGARVTVLVPPSLKVLLQSLPGVDVLADSEPRPEFDLHCSLLSLPLLFRTTLATVPAEVPYLQPPSDVGARWRARLGTTTRPRIGLAWSGNPRHERDRERSMSLAELAPLMELPVDFISLGKDVRVEDRATLKRMPILALGEQSVDFADSAALIACLDLVISVDTATAHLAGALGHPVWIMLDARPDFRWLLDRVDSPWYPTARLFRQHRPKDWTAVVERVAAELRGLLARRERAQPFDPGLQAQPGAERWLGAEAARPTGC
jgi:tetratricopeptide (TPR) repeat protein